MSNVLRSSEFWMGLVAVVGQLGVVAGIWTQEHFNTILLPTLTYIVGRILSKVAKAV